MTQETSYIVAAIPLNRPDVTQYLQSQPPRVGTPVRILAQRPTAAARRAWVQRLANEPTLANFLAIHDPHNHVMQTRTAQLVPVQFLHKPGFLDHNWGGWTAIYFGVMQLPAEIPTDDPLLQHLQVLTEYGPRIRWLGAAEARAAARLEKETAVSLPTLINATLYLAQKRRQFVDHSRPLWQTRADYAQQLRAWLHRSGDVLDVAGTAVPRLLLLDDLLHTLVTIEQERRSAQANGQPETAAAIAAWQERLQQEAGVLLLLKGEYIMGRHRRSTILLLPQQGVVIKQPGLEPFHEVELNAKTVAGQPENWPLLTEGGALVTAAGRLRLVVEEDLVEQLYAVFDHRALSSTLLGLSIEPFVAGPTLQEYVLADPQRMTAKWYEEIVLHQQVCEWMGLENGDWHAANFILGENGRFGENGRLTHVDWGAARPLLPQEKTAVGVQQRLNQVRNIAYSFHDEALAERVNQLHADLIADEVRLAQLRNQARDLIK